MMRSFTDAKAMARTLRSALADKNIELSHSACLELVALQFGLPNWNVLAAKIAASTNDTAAMALETIIPILRIFSREKAEEFYIDFLGFNVDWEHRFADDAPVYLQITRSGISLHLSEHHGDASPGAQVRVRMQGIEAFHRELTDKNYKYNRPGLKDQPWGTREMTVHDPFGNRICFSEPHTE